MIHSYTSGWKGAAKIPDPPVPGALKFIVAARQSFRVAIFSPRSHQWGGRRAMRRWLYDQYLSLLVMEERTPPWLLREVNGFGEPWEDLAQVTASEIVNSIEFPLFKPPAMVSLDDRALTFTGEWPNVQQLTKFRPWNK